MNPQTSPSSVDALVVGAGVSGLACARELARSGRRVVVLERARGVGGRCATRRVEGQPVDHGVAFLHGADPGFAAEVESMEDPLLEGWPVRVVGAGAPCQPEAFTRGQRRWAVPRGISAFPKHLARGLDIRLQSAVSRVEPQPGGMVAVASTAETIRSPILVLALALEQTAGMMRGIDSPGEDFEGALRLLGMMATVPCLTLLAGYPTEGSGPGWDVCYPEDSPALQLIAHDSAKRPRPAFTVLVFQARPAWSRRRLEEPPEKWSAEILEEAGRRLGRWAARPAWTQAHRWSHARLEPGNELSGPILCPLPGGGRVGLAGELFSPGGGVEAAWSSGRRLARRLIEGGGA